MEFDRCATIEISSNRISGFLLKKLRKKQKSQHILSKKKKNMFDSQ